MILTITVLINLLNIEVIKIINKANTGFMYIKNI